MVDCDYCGESFGDEDAYLSHLAADHEGELGAIDRRRVAAHEGGEGGGFSLGPAVLVGLLVLSGALVVWVTFFMGGGGSSPNSDVAAMADPVQQPSGVGTVHYHGTMTVVVDGQELDFSRDRYQLQDNAFHFEGGDGTRFHGHAQEITLEYALETLGIGVQQGVLAFDGTVYNESGGTVVYEVNGNEVNPETYVLQEGDDVRVVAEQSS